MSPDLFSHRADERRKKTAPLADRMRPRTLDEFIGQEEVLGPGTPLRVMIERDVLRSMILWGPPGCGKTTLAKVIALVTKSVFVELSATLHTVADVRSVIKDASERDALYHQRTILFVDEIHRFTKAQQDVLLPHVEKGTIVFIGATTENPSFEVNAALLSRVKVFVMEPLTIDALMGIMERAIHDRERGLGDQSIVSDAETLRALANMAHGDARQALHLLDLVVQSTPVTERGLVLNKEHLAYQLGCTPLLYDRDGDQHYQIISALHKSLRGSDVQASCYWLGRMLEAGEDPLYVARRLVRFASEDVGMADPQALIQAVTAFQACHDIGMPECSVVLTQSVVYLAKAPKSNALYEAYQAVQADIRDKPHAAVPIHLRNAPTALLKDLGFGRDYRYPPHEDAADQTYLPDELQGRIYYRES